MNNRINKFDTKKLVGMAMFTALAFIVSLATAWLKIAFLTIDIKDAVLTVGAFIYGPMAAFPMCIVTALISSLITGFETGIFGLMMDFFSSIIFAFTAALIYKYRRTMKGAITGLFVAVVIYTVAMVPLNLMITPLYTGQPVSAVAGLLKPLLVPFNFAKSVLNAAVVLFIYKPIITALRSAKFVREGSSDTKIGKTTFVVLTVAIITLAVAIAVFVLTDNALPPYLKNMS
jgi:riboflavin transporter FmnP